MKITRNNLLVSVIASKDAVKGTEPMVGEVMMVGPEVKEVVKGDIVTFSPYGFDEIKEGIVIGEGLILAIYDAKPTAKPKG